MEARHLRAFVAVARHRSYTRAAAELRVTQPALSRTIQQLEARLGVRLVDRSSRHVALTTVGHDFLARAQGVLSELDSAVAATSALRSLRLGFSWLLPDPWAQQTIASFKRATGAEVIVVRCDDLPAALRHASIDLAVVHGTATVPGVREVHLFDEDRVAAVSTLSPLADRDHIDWGEFRHWPLVVNTVSGTTGPWSWTGCDAPSRIVTCANYDEWLENVGADLGVGVTPAVAARRSRHSSVRFLPIRNAPPTPVRLLYLTRAPQTLIRQFVEAAVNTRQPQDREIGLNRSDWTTRPTGRGPEGHTP